MITVVGSHRGEVVTRFELGHGEDPIEVLAARGWAGTPSGVDGVLGALTIRYAVEPAPVGAAPSPGSGPEGPGLTRAERRRIEPHQRVAAYAVVVAQDRLLLTQLAPRTGAAGRWNLPGGGIDPGESAEAAVVREVAEETGQVVD
ncbi:MAG TPA: NUDIX domain-containing protein, partial [Ornithinibacter sp.]|nr:NUDIX domain-containing protein [Ornithinibacter sp.]